jgi:hypothetical protein
VTVQSASWNSNPTRKTLYGVERRAGTMSMPIAFRSGLPPRTRVESDVFIGTTSPEQLQHCLLLTRFQSFPLASRRR